MRREKMEKMEKRRKARMNHQPKRCLPKRGLSLLCATVMAAGVILGNLGIPKVSASEQALICSMGEHFHGDGCYQHPLMCGLEEHIHGDGCYDENQELVCWGQEHVHGEACYAAVLACGQQEHTHDADCYTVLETDSQVMEMVPEAVQEIPQEIPQAEGENWEQTDAGSEPIPVSSGDSGSEILDMFTDEIPLDSGEETTDSFCEVSVEETDASAVDETENADVWQRSIESVALTGDYAKDIVAIARTQIGIRENRNNFMMNEKGAEQYYSRYGHWYGDTYAEWSAMFVSFCASYAGIPETYLPREKDNSGWIGKLGSLYIGKDGYTPQAGDLVFFSENPHKEGTTQLQYGSPAHVGIVVGVDGQSIDTVEGNAGGEVGSWQYGLDEAMITGYMSMAKVMVMAGILTEEETPPVEGTDSVEDAGIETAGVEDAGMEADGVEDAGMETEVAEDAGMETDGVEETEMETDAIEDTGSETDGVEETEIETDGIEDAGSEAEEVEEPGAGTDGVTEPETEDVTEIEPEIEAGTVSESDIEATEMITITADDVNLRAQPSMEADVVDVVGSGTKLELLDTVEAEEFVWYKVNYSGILLQETEDAQISEDETAQEAWAASGDETVQFSENPDVDETAQFEENLDVDETAQCEENLDVDETAQFVENLDADEAVQFTENLDANEAAQSLENLEADDAASVEAYVRSDLADVLDEVPFTENILSHRGSDYTVTVSYSGDAQIPENAELSVREIEAGTEEYESYYEQTLESLGPERTSMGLALIRFFDISFMADGMEIEPAAPIDVKISYDESLDISSTTGNIVHFAEYGTEVIEPELTGDGAEIHSFEFAQESFSVSATVLSNIEYNAEVTFGEIGANQTIALPNYYVSDSAYDPEIVSVSGSEKSVTLTALGEGETVVSVRCSEKQNGKGKSTTYTIHVTIEAEKTLTANGPGYTVKVTGNFKSIPDAGQVIVENIDSGSEDYQAYYQTMAEDFTAVGTEIPTDAKFAEEEFDFLQMYHIYLADALGNEVEIPSEANLNLRVEISYDTKPEGLNDSAYVGHYKMVDHSVNRKEISVDGASYSTGVKKVQVTNGSVVFRIKNFSALPIAVPAAEEGGTGETGETIPTQESLLTSEMLKDNELETSNKWQVVDNGYAGNLGENKTVYGSDNNVRVQKNVIATDVENEFLVYLSVDTKQMFEEYFQIAEYQATTSNNYHASALGKVVNEMTGNQDVHVSGTYNYANSALFTIQDHNGNVLVENVRLYWSQANNITFILKLSNGKYVLMGLEVRKDSHNIVRLSEEAEQYIQEEVTKAAQLNQVTDVMGDYIEFVTIEACDGNANYNPDTRQLIWDINVKDHPVREESKVDAITTVWNLNVAELVYRVRLNVEKEGFNSCANNMGSENGDPETYEVNRSATLAYNDNQTVTFPVPHVRGLLYELKFKKVDSEDPLLILEDAIFTLTSTTDHTKTYEAEYLEGGWYSFSNIPWGEYTLTETKPPAGYKTGENSSWAVTVGYTLDLQDDGTAVIDKHIHDSGSVFYRWIGSYDENGILIYDQDSEWMIQNEKIKSRVMFKKVSATNDSIVLQGAEFELYNSEDECLGKMISGADGMFSLESDEIAEGTYYLKEIKAPTGYLLLPNRIKITIADGDVTVEPNNMVSVISTEVAGQTVFTIQVKNEVLYELPSTGGNGIYWYLIGGMLLMMAASLIVYKSKCKEVLKS